jgi:hypothetical protein
MQESRSEKACKEVEASMHAMVEKMNKTNILDGVPRKEIIKSECKGAP